MIRQATPADRPAVERCVRACGRFVRTYFDIRQLAERYDDGHVWIATEDEQVVGFAVAVPLKREDVTSLYEFGVRPDRRGTGIGRKLLAACAVGRPVRLVVDEDNGQAALFYLACGLRIIGAKRVKTGNRKVWQMEGLPC